MLNRATRADIQRATATAETLVDTCLLIAVDGGIHACRAARRRPDLFVGDGDSAHSIPADTPTRIYRPDKDFSDLGGALTEAARRGVQVVIVAGLLGGRLDHEWANLFELGAHAHRFAGSIAPTRRGIVLVTGQGCKMDTVPGRTLSVFALGGMAVVTLRGTRWILRRRRLRSGSLGLSNETGHELDLTVHSGVVAVVCPYETRRSPRRS